MREMPSRLLALTFDAHDPPGLAVFWAGVLGRVVVDDLRGALLPGSDTQVGLRFAPGGAEKVGPNRVHLRSNVSRVSLQADLLAAHERASRLASHIQRLEQRLSEALGEQAWRESGLGAPADVNELHQQITLLEQRTIDLKLQLEERDQDLDAARAANRELMTRLNAPT